MSIRLTKHLIVNQIKVENHKNAKITSSGVKSGLLTFKMEKLNHFFKILTWNFVRLFIDKCPYSSIPLLTKISLKIFRKDNFLRPFSNAQNFQKSKIRDNSLIVFFNLHLLVRSSRLYLWTVLLTTIPARHYFWQKSAEHDVTLTSFTANQSEPRENVRNGARKRLAKSGGDITVVFKLSKEIWKWWWGRGSLRPSPNAERVRGQGICHIGIGPVLNTCQHQRRATYARPSYKMCEYRVAHAYAPFG